MTDENDEEKLHEFDEEAFFDDEEPTGQEAEDSHEDEEAMHQRPSLGEKIKSWAIPIVMGGSIMGFAGYKLYGMYYGASAAQQKSANEAKDTESTESLPATPSVSEEKQKEEASNVSAAKEKLEKSNSAHATAMVPNGAQSNPAAAMTNPQPTPSLPSAVTKPTLNMRENSQVIPQPSPNQTNAAMMNGQASTTETTNAAVNNNMASPANPNPASANMPGMAQLSPPQGNEMRGTVSTTSTVTPAGSQQSAQVDALKQLFNNTGTTSQTAPIATPGTQQQTFNSLNQYWQKNQPNTQAVSPELHKRLDAVQNANDNNQAQIHNVLNEVKDMDKKMTDVNTGLNKLSSSLSSLEKTITALNNEVSNLRQMQQHQNSQLNDLSSQLLGFSSGTQSASAPDSTTSVTTTSITNRDMPSISTPTVNKANMQQTQAPNSGLTEDSTANEFIIEAVIPGRAWLRTPDGMTITVTEGDSLGNLGKVVMIDAQNSSVVTSSGVVLRN